ncbi:MAG: hypothetical protein HYX61_10040 [Gammaproteobacteria bacterium]|jgi:Leucine-rich repeat (LRR) protein|nr:hypothetical protein [Gammaproteobacteria bacterium]
MLGESEIFSNKPSHADDSSVIPELSIEVLHHLLSFVPLHQNEQLRGVSNDWLEGWNEGILLQMNPLAGPRGIQNNIRFAPGFNALWESQQKEIEYLLESESKILEKTNNTHSVIIAFQKLKEVTNQQISILALHAREKVLSKINIAIIFQCIQQSEMSPDQKLDCSACGLTRFPESVIEDNIDFFQTIQRVDICHNHLFVLPENIGHCISLEMLNIFNNRLRALPESIGKCVMLQTLSADINELKILPDSIGDCLALKYLEVNKNGLIALPENIGKCVSLRWISASWNKLTFIPQSIGQCGKLEWLKVSYNQLMMLPYSIVQCEELRRLSISENYITTLPDKLSRAILFDSMAGGFISKREVLATQNKIVDLNASMKSLRLG